MFLAPNGKVFLAGFPQTTRYLDVSGTGTWTTVGDRQVADRTMGSAVMYAPGKILYVGGGDPPTSSAEVIDLNQGSPSWRSVAGMAFARRQLNATILADGQILVTHGTSGAGFNNVAGAVRAAELWNPATESWSTMAEESRPRIYHSTALLLPDARVLASGSGEGGGVLLENSDFSAQVFTPPYLFNADGTLAARPSISSAPSRISYGGSFSVETPDAGSVVRGTLVRLSSVTHAFNQSQLIYPLTFVAHRADDAHGRGSHRACSCAPGPIHAVPCEPGRRTVHGSDGERRTLSPFNVPRVQLSPVIGLGDERLQPLAWTTRMLFVPPSTRLFAGLLTAGVSALGCESRPPEQTSSALSRYHLDAAPTWRATLPKELREISGLAVGSGRESLRPWRRGGTCVRDRATDRRSGEVLRAATGSEPPRARQEVEGWNGRWRLRGHRDRGLQLLLVTSTGILVEFAEGSDGQTVPLWPMTRDWRRSEKWKASPTIPTTQSLVLLCKEMKDKSARGRIEVWAWSFKDHRLGNEPRLPSPPLG